MANIRRGHEGGVRAPAGPPAQTGPDLQSLLQLLGATAPGGHGSTGPPPGVPPLPQQPQPSNALLDHGRRNVASGQVVRNPDGTVSTIRSITVTFDGVPTLIPTVWDGKIVSGDEAVRRARMAKVRWPTFKTIEEANAAARRFSDEMGGKR